jgi:hypothetical protein
MPNVPYVFETGTAGLCHGYTLMDACGARQCFTFARVSKYLSALARSPLGHGSQVERSFDHLPRMIMAHVRHTGARILRSTCPVMVLAVSASLLIFLGGSSQELALFDPLLVR